jgi:hypothetical protein
MKFRFAGQSKRAREKLDILEAVNIKTFWSFAAAG